jgi:hypothetical protein
MKLVEIKCHVLDRTKIFFVRYCDRGDEIPRSVKEDSLLHSRRIAIRKRIVVNEVKATPPFLVLSC